MIELSPIQWTVCAVCAWLVGVGKTGVPGLGIFVVPVLGLAFGDALGSSGILLPLLLVADVFAVAYYRRHAAVNRLWHLAPWVLAGIALGAAVRLLPADALGARQAWIFNALIGAIVMAMVVLHFRKQRRPDETVPADAAHAARYGVTAGFATTVANAAGPVMNLYLLSRRLPKQEFIATGAWFFLVINAAKVPIFVYDGTIRWATLAVDAWLAPAVIVGALTGRRLFDRFPQRAFERTVFALTVLAALLLFVPGSAWRAVAAPVPAAVAPR